MPIEHESPPEQYPEEEAEYHRKTDIEENEATTPPDGEVVRRPVLILSECFVAGDADELIGGLRGLGFDAASWTFPEGDPLGWIARARRGSRGGTTSIIGTVSAQQGLSSLHAVAHRTVSGELPAEFDHVVLRVDVAAPALLILSAGFALTDEASLTLDDQLRTNRYLRLDEVGTSTLFTSAAHRKREEVQAERTRVRELASGWIAQTFAGTLTSQFERKELPGIEVIHLVQHLPFTEYETTARFDRDYRNLLSIDTEQRAYASEQLPGWRIGAPWRPQDVDWVYVAGCKGSPSTANYSSLDDPVRPNPKSAYELVLDLGGLSARLAAHALVKDFEGALGELRDELASTSRPRTTTATLAKYQAAIGSLTFDAAISAHSATVWAADTFWWTFDCPTLVPCDEGRKERGHSDLVAALGSSLTASSEWVLDLETRLREQLVTLSGLEAAAANLRLVYATLWVSGLAAVIAVLALVVN